MADMNNNSGATEGKVVTLSESLEHPRFYEAPAKDNMQTEGKGKNTIAKLAVGQVFNNAGQGEGAAGPSKWGGPDGVSASKSSAEAGTKVAASYSVDLVSGQNSCWNGGNPYKG
jgi:hypothetical protein